MSLTATLSAQQPGPGGPITVSVMGLATTPSDRANLNTLGIGTTTTAAVPTTFASLAHFQELDPNDSFADTAGEQFSYGVQAGSTYTTSDKYFGSKFLRLDTDFAAGKYLWAVVFATGTPSGTDPIVAHAGPYHIT